jgi:glycosyltransferase involved in cell wall biosynthesis
VTALLARGLPARKYEVHLGLISRSAHPSPALPSSVTVHRLGVRRVSLAALTLLRLIRRLQPDVILSGMAHLNFLVLLLKPLFPSRTRVLVRQNATVSADLRSSPQPACTRLLYRLLYPAADRVVCQTPAMAADLAEQSGVRSELVKVLPNPIDFESVRASSTSNHWSGKGPHLLAIGRLSDEKGFDLLLGAFASVRISFPSADLTILGEGPASASLQQLCRSLHLEASVHFPGHVPRPELYFPGATLFVLSSRREGLPNALLEAAAGGLPIAALPSSDGIVDLLDRKPGVWLAPEISCRALTRTLLLALHPLRPGQRFVHHWVEPFAMRSAIQHYEALIDQTLYR